MRKLKNEELGRLSTDEFRKADKVPVVVVLDNVRSLHNVGSVFRTADAFRIASLCLCGYTGTPPNKEITKTALGATETVEWKYAESVIAALEGLKAEGYKICAVEQVENATMLHQFKYSGEKIALVFGNEVYGVQQEVIDMAAECIEIPQTGSKHSLNISVAVGIVLWEIVRSR